MSRAASLVMRIDWALLTAVALLGTIGVINLQSTSGVGADEVYLSQLAWLAVGSGVMVTVAWVDYRRLKRLAPLIYVGAVILLVLVLVAGKEIKGSRRWLEFGGFGFQPSELAKLAIIIALAAWFERVRRPDGYGLRDLAPVGALLGVPILLILQEPDLGHSLMILFIAMSMLAFERFARSSFLTLVTVAVLAAPLMWRFVLLDYQKDRILTLLDGKADQYGTGWHAWQARIAVGSGELLGKGHGMGTQVAGGFLPENHTDFVFANLAEEHGFVGASFVLLLYLFLVLWGLRIAGHARDVFGGHIAVGVAALIFWQTVMNVGMVLNLLPVAGVTLPLMSYGGSSAVTVMAAMGLLLSIGARKTSF